MQHKAFNPYGAGGQEPKPGGLPYSVHPWFNLPFRFYSSRQEIRFH